MEGGMSSGELRKRFARQSGSKQDCQRMASLRRMSAVREILLLLCCLPMRAQWLLPSVRYENRNTGDLDSSSTIVSTPRIHSGGPPFRCTNRWQTKLSRSGKELPEEERPEAEEGRKRRSRVMRR